MLQGKFQGLGMGRVIHRFHGLHGLILPVSDWRPPQKHALARRAGGRDAAPMKALFTYWQEADGRFLGYLNDYPEHWTQGEDLEDLKEQLRDLFAIFTGPT